MKTYLFMLLFLGFCLNTPTTQAQNIATNAADSTKSYTRLEDALKDPDKVFRLDLSNQMFKSFPFEIMKFKNLQYLSLRNDHFLSIPKEISELKNLKTLDLSGNDFSVLPKEFTQLKSLEELYLNQDKNLNLNMDFYVLGQLPKLRILHLEGDGLKKLPKSILRLTHLEQLYLNDNDFRKVPPILKNIKSLQYIDLKGNKFPPLTPKNSNEFGVRIDF